MNSELKKDIKKTNIQILILVALTTIWFGFYFVTNNNRAESIKELRLETKELMKDARDDDRNITFVLSNLSRIVSNQNTIISNQNLIISRQESVLEKHFPK